MAASNRETISIPAMAFLKKLIPSKLANSFQYVRLYQKNEASGRVRHHHRQTRPRILFTTDSLIRGKMRHNKFLRIAIGKSMTSKQTIILLANNRYTASMQDPPRGGYYPANGTAGTMLQPRQYQYSATNPWQREEKEKVRKISKNISNDNVSMSSFC